MKVAKIGYFLESKKPSGNTIYDRTYDFLPVIRVCIVVVSVRPEPELRVTVNAMSKDRGWAQTLDIIFDVG